MHVSRVWWIYWIYQKAIESIGVISAQVHLINIWVLFLISWNLKWRKKGIFINLWMHIFKLDWRRRKKCATQCEQLFETKKREFPAAAWSLSLSKLLNLPLFLLFLADNSERGLSENEDFCLLHFFLLFQVTVFACFYVLNCGQTMYEQVPKMLPNLKKNFSSL